MADELIFSCWCIFATKLRIYKSRVEIGRVFGISTTTIPVNKIASVHKGLTGISLETSGGGRVHQIAPWNRKNYTEIVDRILKLTETK